MKQTIAKGATVFRQGDSADEIFLIKCGRIKLNKISEKGTEATLDFRKAGDMIGENIFAGESTYPFTATALEETITCGFQLSAFQQLILKYPEIGLNVIKSMSNKIASMTSRLESTSGNSLEDWLYKALTTIAKEHGVPAREGIQIPFRLTHEELAFLLGAHRVSVTKSIQQLIVAKKISRSDKNLIIL